jgi:DNA-directed RNA polymerase alpha subunit
MMATGPASVASLPDETPVGDLPLRQFSINALRNGGILSLGDLRQARDSDLLRLRRFGLGALADVRSFVPAPEGDRP